VKCWIKVAGVVTLLAIGGADLGWRVALIAGSPCDQNCERGRQQQGRSDEANAHDDQTPTATSASTSAENSGRDTKSTSTQHPSQNETSSNVWMILQGISAPFVAVFTLILTGVGVGQLYIYRRMHGVMDRQARAEQLAFVAMHRATLVVRRFLITQMHIGRPLRIQYEIANEGMTDATLTGLAMFAALLEARGALEFPPVRLPVGPILDNDVFVPGGQSIIREHVTDLMVSADDVEAIERGWRVLHVLGTIRYLDANGIRRETGFFRYFNPGRVRRFRAVRDPDYEYQY
jgi:hypothetical protein